MSWLNYNGYRDQSEVEKGLFNGRLSHQWEEGKRLTATFNALYTPKAEDPAGLTAAQVEDDRSQATSNARRLDAGQEVDQQTLGLLYETPAIGAGDLTVSTFFTRRDFSQQLPFPGPSRIAYDRQFYGISSDYQQGSEVAGLPLTWVVGAAASATGSVMTWHCFPFGLMMKSCLLNSITGRFTRTLVVPSAMALS